MTLIFVLYTESPSIKVHFWKVSNNWVSMTQALMLRYFLGRGLKLLNI